MITVLSLLNAQNTYTLETGVDYPGNDIKTYTVSSVQECQNYCNENSICVGVVVSSSSSGGCWLKRAFKVASIKSGKLVYRRTTSTTNTSPSVPIKPTVQKVPTVLTPEGPLSAPNPPQKVQIVNSPSESLPAPIAQSSPLSNDKNVTFKQTSASPDTKPSENSNNSNTQSAPSDAAASSTYSSNFIFIIVALIGALLLFALISYVYARRIINRKSISCDSEAQSYYEPKPYKYKIHSAVTTLFSSVFIQPNVPSNNERVNSEESFENSPSTRSTLVIDIDDNRSTEMMSQYDNNNNLSVLSAGTFKSHSPSELCFDQRQLSFASDLDSTCSTILDRNSML